MSAFCVELMIVYFSCSSFRIFISLAQLVEEKNPSISQFMGKDILEGSKAFNSIPHFSFKEVLLISKSHQRVELYLF